MPGDELFEIANLLDCRRDKPDPGADPRQVFRPAASAGQQPVNNADRPAGVAVARGNGAADKAGPAENQYGGILHL